MGDTFSLLAGVVVIILAFQAGQTWLVFGTIAIMMLTMRDWSTTLTLIGLAVSLYALGSPTDVSSIALWVIVGIIAFGVIASLRKPPEPAMPDLYGLEGLQGLEGFGGGI
ncbi:MAG: hypothetical protein V1847_02555 [Candidatus Diapherotrites archaeon]